MEDLIKRSDALNEIASYMDYTFKRYGALSPTYGARYAIAKDFQRMIARLPSADRPQGEWIKDEDGTYRCSNCGGCEEQYIYGTENWYGCGESKFCPSCGCRMKGADDDI